MGRISPAGDGLGSGPISRNRLMRRIVRAKRAVTTALFVFIMSVIRQSSVENV
jgi:hypothetical protein